MMAGYVLCANRDVCCYVERLSFRIDMTRDSAALGLGGSGAATDHSNGMQGAAGSGQRARIWGVPTVAPGSYPKRWTLRRVVSLFQGTGAEHGGGDHPGETPPRSLRGPGRGSR